MDPFADEATRKAFETLLLKGALGKGEVKPRKGATKIDTALAASTQEDAEACIDRLEKAGLVTVDRKKRTMTATTLGLTTFPAPLVPAKPTRTLAPSPATADLVPAIEAALAPRLDRIEQALLALVGVTRRLEAIEESLATISSSPGASTAAPPSANSPHLSQPSPVAVGDSALPEDFDRRLHIALRDANANGRHGGLVPLPALRRALAPLGMSRDTLDRALLERLRARTLDIKVANDPRRLPDAELGILDEGRGLLYYVVSR